MGHMVCDPCSCFLLLCILIVQLYQVFGAQNNMPMPDSMPFDEEKFRQSQGFSKEHMAKSKTCSTKCMNRVTELGLRKGKVRASMDCTNACMMGTTKPEDFEVGM